MKKKTAALRKKPAMKNHIHLPMPNAESASIEESTISKAEDALVYKDFVKYATQAKILQDVYYQKQMKAYLYGTSYGNTKMGDLSDDEIWGPKPYKAAVPHNEGDTEAEYAGCCLPVARRG